MGASFNAYTFDLSKGIDKIKEVWNEGVEQSLYESGHNYSGDIGMLGKGFEVQTTIAEDADEAREYIVENQEKWNGAMAVKTKDNKIVIGGWCSS